MKKLFILLFLGSFFLGKAQETPSNLEFKHTHSIGLTTLKTLPVIGVGYRHETKKKFLLELNLGITRNSGPKVRSQKSGYWGLTELSVLYEIGKPSRTDFYIYLANGLVKKTFVDYDLNNEEVSYYTRHFLGVGVEFLILKLVGLNMFLGILNYSSQKNWIAGGAGIALYYKF